MNLKRNLLLIAIGVVGVMIAGSLAPEIEVKVGRPTLEVVQEDESLPLPPIGPRDEGFHPLSQPFLFKLESTDKVKGEERERQLQAQYRRILEGLHGQIPKVEVERIDGMTVVAIDGQSFATVLPADAPEYYSRLSDGRKKAVEEKIARRWKQLLDADLAEETVERSPESLARFPYTAAVFFFLGMIFHALADMFARKFLKSPGWSLKAFVWLACLSITALIHPTLKPLAITIIKGGLEPVFFFLLIVSFCSVGYRVACRVLENYAKAYIAGHRNPSHHMQQRIDTMLQGGRFLIGTVVLIFGVAWFMSAIGIDLAKAFAGAGVAGVALGIVGKDILIDYFYGINILADDQFHLGDYIETPVATGTVEKFNLRTTRIRETDGGLSIVTNGKLTLIKNHSRDFGNVDFKVGVAYGSDTDRCFVLMGEELAKLAEEKPGIVQPEFIFTGVHELGVNGVVLRAMIRTAPLQQWGIRREFNRRILHRFEKEKIDIPFPQQTMWLRQTEAFEVQGDQRLSEEGEQQLPASAEEGTAASEPETDNG